MEKEKLDEILSKHAAWLVDEPDGERANLRGADLTGANLRSADLTGANLREADLTGADLSWANLRRANLRGADLTGADLREADLTRADMRGANLRGADIDFSCWPLWCGSTGVKVDVKIFAQLAAHLCAVEVDDEGCKAAQAALLPLAQKSHRAGELGLLYEV